MSQDSVPLETEMPRLASAIEIVKSNLDILHVNGKLDEFEARMPKDFRLRENPTVRQVFEELTEKYPELELTSITEDQDQ